jgi:hypothetical protein
MRYFELLGFQHLILYLFPAIAFAALFIIGLGFYHFRRKGSEERQTRITEEFPGGILGRNAPFPLLLYLILVGTIVWVFTYILLIGILEVKI